MTPRPRPGRRTLAQRVTELRARRAAGDDAGVSLVELIIYSLLLSFVVFIAGGLLIQTLETQRDTTSLNDASNSAQVAVREMERGLRNAVQVQIPSAHGGNLLIIKTRVGDDPTLASSWECRAWYYDAASDEIRYLDGPATGTPVTRGLTAPLDTSAWRTVLSNVMPTPNGASVYQVFESEALGGAKIKFDVLAETGHGRMSTATTVIPREQGTTIGGVSCT